MASDRLCAVEGLDVSEVTDGLVVYDPAHDRVHYLNATAGVVFSLCNGQRDRAEIAATVSQLYDDEPLARDVEECLAQLEAEGVLRSAE